MFRLFPKRTSHKIVSADEDAVVAAFAIPSDGVLNNIWGEIHIVTSSTINLIEVVQFDIGGYIVPVLDPDASADVDDLWDVLVPKPGDASLVAATASIDLNAAAGGEDVGAFAQVGEVSWREIFDVGVMPEKLYQAHYLKSHATARHFIDAATDFYRPSHIEQIRHGRRMRVQQPSMVLYAVSQPELADATTAQFLAPAENEWTRLKYVEVVLMRAMEALIGLTEATAESPFSDAITLIEQYLAPDMSEETANSFTGWTMQCFSQFTADISVPGEFEIKSLAHG